MTAKTPPLDLDAVRERVRELLTAEPPVLPWTIYAQGDRLPGAVVTASLLVSTPASRPEGGERYLAMLLPRTRGRSYYASTGTRGWNVENGGGYGEADTRAFGGAPKIEKIASSIADVARKRAVAIKDLHERKQRDAAAQHVDEVAGREACRVLGLTGPDAEINGYGSGRGFSVVGWGGRGLVRVKLHPYELVCWPDEAPLAITTMQRWKDDAALLGLAREEPEPHGKVGSDGAT